MRGPEQAVDAGWKPHRHRIGRTGKAGKAVSSRLHIAAGFGVVGHLRPVLPAMTEDIGRREGWATHGMWPGAKRRARSH
ncbi:hypothetical protein [Streptomyces brasiliscabiei]|uniref:hypothetical protein n=1 Tax=Streptomyces brasiliscabiei TaxID=2736302 RepID=UPI001C0FBBB6|nr:hypothetical protein [Streptomyces brasiliscabiei]